MAQLSEINQRRVPPPSQPRERAAFPGGVLAKPMKRLDQDMRRSDLIWCLEHLTFRRSNTDHRQPATLCIDKPVRDFILRAIRSR